MIIIAFNVEILSTVSQDMNTCSSKSDYPNLSNMKLIYIGKNIYYTIISDMLKLFILFLGLVFI